MKDIKKYAFSMLVCSAVGKKSPLQGHYSCDLSGQEQQPYKGSRGGGDQGEVTGGFWEYLGEIRGALFPAG